MELFVMVPGTQGIASEPNRRYQFTCRKFLLSRFLEGALYKYPEWTYAIYDKNTGKEIVVSCSLLDWLIVCVRVWPMTDAVNYYEKALKILFWSPILRPLSPAPGDNCPLCPPYTTPLNTWSNCMHKPISELRVYKVISLSVIIK